VSDHPGFVDSPEEVEYVSEQATSLLCHLCSEVVSQPVECESLVCASCCCRWIQVSRSVECPCCYRHQLDDTTINLPSVVVLDLLGTLRLSCNRCSRTTIARQYHKHKESNCQGHYELVSPFQVTVENISPKASHSTYSASGKAGGKHLVRRLMSESEDSVLRIPTRGQVGSISMVSSI